MARLDNLDYEVNGVTTNYEIVPEIAPLFNATTAYAAGDTVIEEGHLYRFNTAHAAGAWIGTDADEITVGEELTAHDADIVQIKNLQAPTILSDTYSGTTLSTINVNIPAGTYTLEVESLTSADVDTELSLVTFVYSGGSLSVRLSRERNIKKKVTFKGNVTTMYLYASDSYAHSVGDAFSFTGLKLITGYPLKDEVDDLSQTVQGLSGRYTTYEAGGRTFTDNTLAYIGANNTIVLGNTNGYAVYTYNITEPTSFVVTGSTRGASNYIAIATDDSGKCVQTIEQGASATTKSYSNFEFTIDDFEATTVYICLYKQPTDEVLIKLNKDVKELSILFVGNSLTQDGIAYLPYLLTRYYPEFRFRFYMWYNGGYDLSQQYAKFTADTECESFSIAEGTPAWTNTTAKMSDVLSTYRFNIVCMQEYFNRKASYTDADLTDWNNCHDYIVSHYTGGNALEFISLFHSPWLTDEQSVYDLTKTGNALILKKTVADDMIATGIALHMARSTALDSLGDQGHLTPDSVHAQEGLPCLLETYTALLWVLDRYGFPTTIYGLPFKMTAGIQSSIAVPGANIGTGVIEGTDAQNLLAQEVAVMAYKVGKKFVVDNLTADDELTKLKADLSYHSDMLNLKTNFPIETLIEGVRYINASTGAVGSTATGETFSHTDYVNISCFTKLIYKRVETVSSNPAFGMAFYDASKSYISGENGIGGSSLGYVNSIISVPENAVYARFTTLNNTTSYGEFSLSAVNLIESNLNAINDGSNIWDLAIVNENFAVRPNGDLGRHSDYDAIDFYAIPNGCIIYGFGSRYAFYDNTKTLLSGQTGILNTEGIQLSNGMHYVVAPENAAYFRICASKVLSTNQKITYVSSVFDRCLLDAINNPLKTRKLYCLGDSITRGMYAEIGASASSGPTSLNYPYWIGLLNNYDVVNYGNSGSGWANKGSAETVDDMSVNRNAKDVVDTESFDDADIITLAFGVNDWKGEAQDIVLGDMTSVSGDGTVIGNMKYCIETLADPINGKAKQAQIIVLLPLNTNRQWSGMDTMTLANNWAFGYAYRNNQTLEDYRTAIKTCAEYYNVKVIDLEEVCPINRLNIRQMLGDGLHPTKAFHKQMGQALAPYIH